MRPIDGLFIFIGFGYLMLLLVWGWKIHDGIIEYGICSCTVGDICGIFLFLPFNLLLKIQ